MNRHEREVDAGSDQKEPPETGVWTEGWKNGVAKVSMFRSSANEGRREGELRGHIEVSEEAG